MKHFLSLVVCIALVLQMITLISSLCNVCNSNTNFACISDTEYQQCVNGIAVGTVQKCYDGTYCSVLGYCSNSASQADCRECFKCDTTKTFACIGTKTAALCLGGDSYTDMVTQCTGQYVCNIESSNICTIDSAATCSIRADTTEAPTTARPTTPSPINNAQAFCAAMGVEGRYPVGTDVQTTCHQFVHCYFINNVWYAPIYNCRGTMFYDSSIRDCVTTIPARCSSNVRGLSYRGILLE